MTKIKDAEDGLKSALVGSERLALTDDIANPLNPDVSTNLTSIKNFVVSFVSPGESNSAVNLGTGLQIFKQKTGVNLELRSINVLNNKLGISEVSDVLTLQLNEVNINFDNIPDTINYVKITPTEKTIISNSVSSVVSSGVGADIIKSKIGNDLILKTLISSDSSVTFTENVDDIDLKAEYTTNNGDGLSLIDEVVGNNVRLRGLDSSDGSITISEDNIGNNINLVLNGSLGEVNTISNIGTGTGVFFQKNGTNFELKSLKQGSNITITNDADSITINAAGSVGEANTASNIGTGAQIFREKIGIDLAFRSITSINGHLNVEQFANTINLDLGVNFNNVGGGAGVFKSFSLTEIDFRTLVGEGSVSVIQGTNTLTVSSQAEKNTMSNIGAIGSSVFKQKTGVNFELRKLRSTDTNLAILTQGDEIHFYLPNGIGEENDGQNTGTGASVYNGKDFETFQFRRLRSTTSNLVIAQAANDISFSMPNGIGEVNSCSNVGIGEDIFKQKNGTFSELKSLIGGSGINVSSGVNEITIAFNGAVGEVNTASNVGTQGARTFKQKTSLDLEFRRLRSSNLTIDIEQETDTINFRSNQRNGTKVSYPVSTDDSGDFYDEGSNLIETSFDNIWTCLDASSGSADWAIIASRDTRSVTTTFDCREGLIRSKSTAGVTDFNFTNWKNGYHGFVDINVLSNITITVKKDGSTTGVHNLNAAGDISYSGAGTILFEFWFCNDKLFFRYYEDY